VNENGTDLAFIEHYYVMTPCTAIRAELYSQPTRVPSSRKSCRINRHVLKLRRVYSGCAQTHGNNNELFADMKQLVNDL
jgi:hypothetical protein